LNEGQLFRAVVQEKEARDSLRKIARDVAPPQSESEVLRAAARDLSRLIEEQSQITAEAAKANADFEKWIEAMAQQNPADSQWRRPLSQLRVDQQLIKQFEAAQRERVDQLPALENTEGDLANKSDLLAQDLAAPAPGAAESLRAAQVANARSAGGALGQSCCFRHCSQRNLRERRWRRRWAISHNAPPSSTQLQGA
jgi:hypothetical protein